MKNFIIFSLVLFGFALINACDPLEDEIREITENASIVKDMTYTLTDDDYDISDAVCGCSGFGNFSSEDDVKDGVPVILSTNFSALGEGSSAIVTYDFYNGSSPDLNGTQNVAIVTDSEYEELGFSFGNFSDLESDIPLYASFKYPDAEDGDFADITHRFWTGSSVVDTLSRAVFTVAYGWQYTWILPQEVYDFFGESSTEYPEDSGNYTPDFSYEDEASEVLHIYLNEFMSIFAEEGDLMLVQFNFDNGADPEVENPTEQDVLLYIYSGAEWLSYGDAYQVTAETLSFGHDGLTWVPDNTIKYTLSGSDYEAIGNATAASNPAGSASILQYSNFDLGLWTSEQIFDAVAAQMIIVFPGTAVDQKYSVTYATWQPGAGTGTVRMIWDGSAFQPIE